MATLEQLSSALRNADAAGDTAAAKRFAQLYQEGLARQSSVLRDTGQGRFTSGLSNLGRGVASVVPNTVGGLGYLTGSDTLTQTAEDIERGINRALPVNPLYEQEFSQKAANVLGQAAGTMLTAGAGGAVGKALGGVSRIGTGAQTAALGSGFLAGAREGGQEAERYGMEGSNAYLRTLAGGATELLTEKIPFGLAAETGAARRMLGEALDKGGTRFLGSMGTEAAEEASAQALGNIATKVLAPEGVETPGILEGTLEAGGLGAVGGAAFGGVNALTGNRQAAQAQPSPTIEGDTFIPYSPPQDLEESVAELTPKDIQDPVVQQVAQTAATAVAENSDVVPATAQALSEIVNENQAPAEQPVSPEEEIADTEEVEDLTPAIERNRALLAQAAATLRGEGPQLPESAKQVFGGSPESAPVAQAEQETPSSPAETEGGSQGTSQKPEEGSISPVAEPTVVEKPKQSSRIPLTENAPVSSTERQVAEDDRAEYNEFLSLLERRGQTKNKVKGVSFSSKDEARFQELSSKLRHYFIEGVDPVSDPSVGEDISGNTIRRSKQGTFYTVEGGRIRTGVAFKDAPTIEQRRPLLTENAPVQFKREGKVLTGTYLGRDASGRHVIESEGRRAYSASAPIPLEGPEVSISFDESASPTPPPTTTQLALTQLQVDNEELTDVAKAKWTPEVYQKAQQFYETGDSTALDGLTTIQKARVRRALLTVDEEASAAQAREDRRGEDRIRKQEKADAKFEGKTTFLSAQQPTVTKATKEQLDQVVADFLRTSPGLPVTVITPEQLATAPEFEGIRRTAEALGVPLDQIEGSVNPSTQSVFVVANQVRSPERAREVLIHELVGHYGIEAVATEAEMQRIAGIIERVAPDIIENVDFNYANADAATRTREILARFSEQYRSADPENLKKGWKRAWDEIKRIVKAIIKRIGGNPNAFDDIELHRMFTRAVRRMQQAGEQMQKRGRTPIPQDEEYLKAVEEGDLKRASYLVDKAAKEAGYDTQVYRGSEVQEPTAYGRPLWVSKARDLAELYAEDEAGEPGEVRNLLLNKGETLELWKHRFWPEVVTMLEAKRYPKDKIEKLKTEIVKSLIDSQFSGYSDLPNDDVSSSIAKPSKSTVAEWRKTGRTWENFIKEYNKRKEEVGSEGVFWNLDGGDIASSWAEDASSETSRVKNNRDLVDAIFDLGFDSVSQIEGGYQDPLEAGATYVVKDSSRVKSSEVITRDDEGKVIPLSRRFNPKRSDIRLSLADQRIVDSPNFPGTEAAQAAYEKGLTVQTKARFRSHDESLNGYLSVPQKEMIADADAFLDSMPLEEAFKKTMADDVPASLKMGADGRYNVLLSKLMVRLNTAMDGTQNPYEVARLRQMEQETARRYQMVGTSEGRALGSRALSNAQLAPIAPILAAEKILMDKAQARIDRTFEGGTTGVVDKVEGINSVAQEDASDRIEALLNQLFNLSPDTTIEEAVRSLTAGQSTRDQIINEVAKALMLKARGRLISPEKKGAIASLIAGIKNTLGANVQGDARKSQPASLGENLARAFVDQQVEGELFTKSWEEGRQKVFDMLYDMELDKAYHPARLRRKEATDKLRYLEAGSAEQRAVNSSEITQLQAEIERLSEEMKSAKDAADALVDSIWSQVDTLLPVTPPLAFSPPAARNAVKQGLDLIGFSKTPEGKRRPIREVLQNREKVATDLLKVWEQEALNSGVSPEAWDAAKPQAAQAIDVVFNEWQDRIDATPRTYNEAEASAERIIQGLVRPKELTANEPHPVRKLFDDHLKRPLTEQEFMAKMTSLGVSPELVQILFRNASDMIEGKRIGEALKAKEKQLKLIATDSPKLVEMLNALRKKLYPGLNWRNLFMELPSQQLERQREIFRRLRLDERLQGLTQEEAIALTNELDKAWQRERRKVFTRELNKAGALGEKSPKDKEKVVNALPQLLRQINLGVFNSEAFRIAVAPQYGLRPLTAEESRDLRKKAEEAWGLPEGVRRNKKLGEIINSLQKTTGSSRIELLNNYWTASVLSGLATHFDTYMAVLNGMGTNLLQGAALIARGRGKEAFNAHLQWWSGLQQGARESMQILLARPGEADYSILKNFGRDLNKYMEGDSNFRPLPLGESLWKNGNLWEKYWAAPVMMFVGRSMAAADHINNTATTYGSLAVARALHPELYENAGAFTSEEIKAAQDQATAEIVGDEQPTAAQKAEISVRAREILQASMRTEDVAAAYEVGDVAAFQGDPTGLFGSLYSGFSGLFAGWERKLENFSEDTERAGAATRAAAAVLASGLRGVLGAKFMRFGFNFGQDLTRYIPGTYLLQNLIYEKDMTPLQKDLLLGKNIFGLMAAMTLTAFFLGGDDDDEEGMFIEGNWSDKTPEETRAARSAGREPFTMGWRNKDGSVSRLSYRSWPTSGIFVAVGAMADQRRDDPKGWAEAGPAGHLLRAVTTGALQVRDVSAMRGLAEMFGAASRSTDPEQSLRDLLIKTPVTYGGGFIPTLLKDIDMWNDPRNFKPETMLDEMMRVVPILRREAAGGRPMLNILGEEVEVNRTPWRRVFTTSNAGEAYNVLGNLLTRGLSLPEPSGTRIVKYQGKDTPIEAIAPDALWQFTRILGGKYKVFLENYGDRLKKMSTPQAQKFIRAQANKMSDQAERELVQQLNEKNP